MKALIALYRTTSFIFLTVVLLIFATWLLCTGPSQLQKPALQEVNSAYSDNRDGWHKIDLGAFSLRVPISYRYYKIQGIDSYVGLISDGTHSIHFDYGWYSNSLEKDGYYRSCDTINGKVAYVVYRDSTGAGVHFPHLGEMNKLTLYSSSIDKTLALDIFKTLSFPGADGYTPVALGQNDTSYGVRNLFAENCKACHKMHSILVGPALNEVVSRHGYTWFKSWLTEPEKLIKNNADAAKLYEEYFQIMHPVYELSDSAMRELAMYIEEMSSR